MREIFGDLLLSNKKIFFIGFVIFIFFVLFNTFDHHYIDTGDYSRVINGALNYDFPAQRLDFFSLKIKDHFSKFDYFSSYTLIVYGLAWVVSFFSETFNIKIVASVLKALYIVVLFKIYSFYFKEKNLLNLMIFILASLPLLSSANIGIFSSYYQEQLVLILLPVFLIGFFADTMKGFFISLLSILIIATAKSQFFYLPVLTLFFYVLFSRDKILKKLIFLIFVQIIAIYTAFSSTVAVNLNKYHSEYFGLYQYQKLNGKKIDDKAKDHCIGVDAWGHKFDIELGAISTDIGGGCIEGNSNYSHKKIINYFLNNPLDIIYLLFDKAANKQVREDYFHVYHNNKIIVDKDGIFQNIKNIKDKVFLDRKMALILLVFLSSAVFYKNKHARIIMFLSLFSISQLYVSFFGEGYRDLSKHLFAMNFSFDLILFLLSIAIFSWIRNITSDYRSRRESNQTHLSLGVAK
ncbi:MAG: hypothetical protein ABWY08_18095 [Comamonas sp.]